MKIAKIINKCNDCQHCILASANKETSHFAICGFNQESNFILFNSSEPAYRFDLTIPDNCPLENYTGTQKIENDE